MGTVYWDFLWAACFGVAGSGSVLITLESPGGLIGFGIPAAILCAAGTATFTLSAILRGVAYFF